MIRIRKALVSVSDKRGVEELARGLSRHGIEVLSTDLPIVIECVETADRIQAVLPELDTMIGGGLITLERANVIMYRPHKLDEEGADDWSLDVGRA